MPRVMLRTALATEKNVSVYKGKLARVEVRKFEKIRKPSALLIDPIEMLCKSCRFSWRDLGNPARF